MTSMYDEWGRTNNGPKTKKKSKFKIKNATTHLIDLEDHVIVLNVTVSRYDGLKNAFFGVVSGRVRVVRADDVTIWVDGFAFDRDARVSYDASKDEWSLRVERVEE